ncbi:hypothetical protein WAZ07_14855 [Bacillus sp. FJAT-51639]|uniref:Uncharacterized protein n=1 Tax=Bacillus bruguierae TaxID=3127667 RepID=A0ABU8FIP7_9BACI
MIRNITFVLFCIFYFIFNGNFIAEAAVFSELPLTKASERWNVEIREAKNEPKISKAKKGVYDVYTLNVKSLEKTAYNVQIEVYRNDKDSSTLHEIVGSPRHNSNISTVGEFFYSNLPVAVKAEGITIIITWQEEPYHTLKDGRKIDARKHKEIFVFN